MTVDPNQVFNQHEYQRRKKIAEAEAQAAKQTEKRRLEEAQQKIRSDTSEPANGNTGGRVTGSSGLEGVSFQQSRAPRPSSTDSAGGATNESKEKREAELKALFGSMFGQMRELKAKDPAMFLEIWEEFKKVSIFPSVSIQLLFSTRLHIVRPIAHYDPRNQPWVSFFLSLLFFPPGAPPGEGERKERELGAFSPLIISPLLSFLSPSPGGAPGGKKGKGELDQA